MAGAVLFINTTFNLPSFHQQHHRHNWRALGIEIGLKKISNGLSWMKKGSCGKLVYAALMWWKAEAYVGLRGKEQGPANLRRIRVRKSGIIAIGSCIQKCFQAKWRKMSWPKFMLRCKFWKSRWLMDVTNLTKGSIEISTTCKCGKNLSCFQKIIDEFQWWPQWSNLGI